MITPTVPIEGELDIDALATKLPLSGARIKNALFKAAFRAASARGALSQRDLELAAREELEAESPPGLRAVGFGSG